MKDNIVLLLPWHSLQPWKNPLNNSLYFSNFSTKTSLAAFLIYSSYCSSKTKDKENIMLKRYFHYMLWICRGRDLRYRIRNRGRRGSKNNNTFSSTVSLIFIPSLRTFNYMKNFLLYSKYLLQNIFLTLVKTSKEFFSCLFLWFSHSIKKYGAIVLLYMLRYYPPFYLHCSSCFYASL